MSNPPYSVPSFRQTTRNYYTEQDFELYDSLTDNSSEIECLFVERTKQLLKDGGVAGVILPSSILSNGGIYTKAREIILQYFDIVAIAELGSNTFMATNTNTVALFLIRRDNYFAANTRSAVETYFRSLNDVTINGIETPASKYVAHVWEGLEYSDYVTLLQKSPNDKVKSHDIYTEYKQKISAKTEAKFWEILLGIEAEKLLYFILAYPQKVVIVKSGEKDIEKHFLGYEFSNRRGCEGIHAIQKGKNIDECTKLFDVNSYDNPEKASTYIYRAFRGDYSSEIAKNMQQHISRVSLIDILTFDRDTFEKNLSLVAKKKVNYELVWRNQNLKILGEIADIQKGTSITKEKTIKGNIPVIAGGKDIAYYHNVSNRDGDIITISASGAYSGFVNYFSTPIFASDCNTVKSKDEDVISTKLIYVLLQTIQSLIYDLQKGQAQPHVYGRDISNIKIPVPPIDVQRQIIREIGKIDETANDAKLLIETSEVKIEKLLSSISYNDNNINEVAPFVTKSIKYTDIASETYITTNNMLQNKWGVVPFEGEANISSITEYKKDDILISNIRPYLKKIWFADKEGGCSKDVLVLRSADRSKYLPKYIFYMLRRDAFFDYVMEGKKGIKMPRGNKEDMMKYKIPVPHIDEQKRIVVQIEALELEITKARKLIENVVLKKQAILDKYL